ncbi:MAG TPA: ComEA family DNA-binding protein [Ignavibacteria bacterium]
MVAGFSIKFYKQVLGGIETKDKINFTETDKRFLSKSEKLNNPEFEKLPYEGKEKLLIISEDSLKSAEKEKKTRSKKEDKLVGRQININTASKEELILLPGVGEKTALKIIDYREKNDSFKKIEEIMNIKGIGQKKFEKMKIYIKVE